MKRGNKVPVKKAVMPPKRGGMSPIQFGQKFKAGGKVKKGC